MLSFHKLSRGLLLVLSLSLVLSANVWSATENSRFVFPQGDVALTAPQVRVVIETTADKGPTTLHYPDDQGEASETLPPGSISSKLVALRAGANTLTLTDAQDNKLDALRIFYSADLTQKPAPAEYQRLFLHGKDDLTLDCAMCHPTKKQTKKPNYNKLKPTPSCSTTKCHNKFGKAKFIHGPAQKGSCISCHNPHGTVNKSFVVKVKANLCYTCHTRLPKLWDKPIKHKPVAEGDCLACHDQHQANLKFQLKGTSVKELCLSCHKKKRGTHRVEHEPVAAGRCLDCHNPHVSNYKGLLHEDGGKICFKCHKNMRGITGKEFQHGPVKKNDCTKCHLVHGSGFDFLLIDNFEDNFYGDFKVERFKFCFKCHEKKVFTDPGYIKTNFRDQKRNLHFLHVNATKRSSCKMCHEIHSSGQERIIRQQSKYIKKYQVSLKFAKTATGGTCLAACHKKQAYDRGEVAE